MKKTIFARIEAITEGESDGSIGKGVDVNERGVDVVWILC